MNYILVNYYQRTPDEYSSRIHRMVSPANFSLGKDPVINSTEKPVIQNNTNIQVNPTIPEALLGFLASALAYNYLLSIVY